MQNKIISCSEYRGTAEPWDGDKNIKVIRTDHVMSIIAQTNNIFDAMTESLEKLQ